MATANTIIRGRYLDSVKLMQISQRIRQKKGIIDAVAVVATSENKSILQATGMLLEDFKNATGSDICLAVKADTAELAENSMKEAENRIVKGLPGSVSDEQYTEKESKPYSLESAVKRLPDANLVLISLAGRYAVAEAEKALKTGRHVLLFSDNVSLQDEKLLKEYAVSHNLLMMGPDCGTAIINGVALAFANAVRKGKAGIVSAAGTGLQEVSSLIHNYGEGISQAFGTGGRDGRKEIGGTMLCFCLKELIIDPATEVIVLISKLPDEEVTEKIWQLVRTTEKPVVYNFLRAATPPELKNIYQAETLAETARKACELLTGQRSEKEGEKEAERLFTPKTDQQSLKDVAASMKETGRLYLRALYSGGTLSYEAQNIFYRKLGYYVFSNTPVETEWKLSDVWQSKENTIIDLGSDEFTVGRPHPMIDYSLRLKKLQEESKDPATAVILLDVVLGYGSHPEPHQELAPIINKIRRESGIVVVCAVIGTDKDLQNRGEVMKVLEDNGAVVFDNNAESALYAVSIIEAIARC